MIQRATTRDEILALLEAAAAEAARLGMPLLIDICCCQGGASEGYRQAGFYVVGLDIEEQPRYPFPMIQADAVWFLIQFADWLRTHAAAVHASPPCQAYSLTQQIQGNDHPELIAPIRVLLVTLGLPYVIENVKGAPLIDPAVLCGAMFGLATYRDRLFEVGGFELAVPEHPEHTRPITKMGRPRRPGQMAHYVGNFSGVPEARRDMGMPHANRRGLSEAIPPVYARFIGEQLMTHIQSTSLLVSGATL